MYPLDSAPSDPSSASGPDVTSPDMRIDAAHGLPLAGGQDAADGSESGHSSPHGLGLPERGSSAEGSPSATQLRTQAIQLADHLAVRHDELLRKESTLNAQAAELESNLRNARSWLRQRENDLERLRRRWLDERRLARSELEAARRRLDQEHRRDWADLQAKRVALEQRAEEVDRAWSALHQVYEEVAQARRESLELRLANEQLREELGLLVPAEVRQQTVAEVRATLSEEYRRESEVLTRQKQELLAIRRDLAEQHRKLATERDRLHCLAGHVARREQRARHAGESGQAGVVSASSAPPVPHGTELR